MEHLPNPITTLLEIRRILKSDGTLIIAVPNIGGFTARLTKNCWFGLDVPRHLFHFTPETLKRSLHQTGFSIDFQKYMSLEQDVIGLSQSLMNKFRLPYNIFYDLIRTPSGKMRHRRNEGVSLAALCESISILIIGGVLSLLALPVAYTASLFRSGGTIENWSSLP